MKFGLKKKAKPAEQPADILSLSASAGSSSIDLEAGVPTIKDLMAPPSFIRDSFDHLGIGNRVMRSFLLAGFPKNISVGWADKLYNYDGDLDMAIHITPMDERAALDQLTDKITQFEAQLDIEAGKGQNRNVTRLGNQIQELYREREKIEQNYISMFQVQMICNLYAKTMEQLEKETQMLDNSLRGQKIKLMPLHLRQDQGYKSGMPYGMTWLPKNFRNFSSEGLTACFPFYNAEISHATGTLMGVNLQTQTPIYVDFYDRRILENGNTTILGRAGSGKTFFVSLITMRSALAGIRSVIIDPEGEYSSITEALGGTVIKIAPGSGTIPNPFDIRNAQGELTGMQIPIDREKYAEVSGVSFNKDKTVTLQGPALVPSDSGYVAPQLVPDGVSAATHELERGEAERLYADMSSFVEGFGGSSSKSSGAFTFTIPNQSLDDVTSVYEGLNSVPAVSVNQSGADYTQFTLSASQMNQVTSPFRVDLEPSAPVQQIIESRSAAAEYIQTHPVTPPAPAPAMNAGAAPQPAFSSGAYTPLDMSQVNMDGPPPQRSDERRDIDRISRPPRAKFTT